MLSRRRDLLALAAAAAASPAVAATATPSREGPSGPWTGGGFVPTVGGRLRYVTLGPKEGEPLVLLHKVGGWVADWRFVAPALAADRRIIAFDLPGHGQSTMIGQPPPMVTLPQMAATILAALEEMGVERCAILGNSAGGLAGLVAAACWPERISKLGLISVSLIPPMTRAQYEAQDRARTQNPPSPEQQAAIFATVNPAVEAEQKAAGAVARAWMGPMQIGVGQANVISYLPRIEAPTLLINADRGRYLKYEAVARQHVKNLKTAVIPNSGAFTHQDNPAATLEALKGFF